MESSNNKSSIIEAFINKNSTFFNEEDLELVKYRLLNLHENQLFFLRVLNFVEPSFLFRKGEKNRNYKLIISQIDFFEDQNNTTILENLKQSNIEIELTENLIVPSYKKMIDELEFLEEIKDKKFKSEDELEKFWRNHLSYSFNFVELEKILKEEKDSETARIAAYKNILSERYFLEEDHNEKPYKREEIIELLNNGELKLSSKIKLGYFIKEYSPLINFKEFNQRFKDFL